MKKKLLGSIVLCLSVCLTGTIAHADPSFGERVKINEGWRFVLDPAGDYPAADTDDTSWRLLDLPHDWSVEGKASPDLASCTGYLPGGVGWYRKSIVVPNDENGRKQFLYFEGVYNNSEVWINGHWLGLRPNGYISFMYDITPYVKYGAENTIAVKVDHSKSADSRWYTGSGIYRDVYLVTSDRVHIDLWGLFATPTHVSRRHADVAVSTTLVNETANDATVGVKHVLYEKEGKKTVAVSESSIVIPAGGRADDKQSLGVTSPRLWSVEDPALYRLETTVEMNGRVIDRTATVTGIRDARFDADRGFSLNGTSMKIKGVCLHHDAGSLGSAVPRRVWERRLQALKDMGCNAVRMSHNPQSTDLYNLCDEMGFLVMDEAFDEWEFPKRKWIEGWNVGKNPGYQGYAEYFNAWSERDLAAMVMKNRNHPSIIMWSIGNEVDYPNDPYTHPILDREGINQKTVPGFKPDKPRAERYGKIAVDFVKLVKSIDTTRTVTGALAGVVMSNYTDYPGALDAVGYNYTESRYQMDHGKYPGRIIYGSENRHDYEAWKAVRDNDFISGQFLWTGIDYLGESHRWPSRGMGSGLFDLAGFMKTIGQYRKSLWSDEPMVYLATKQKSKLNKNASITENEPLWSYPEASEEIRVAAFTNCEEVLLYLNGEKIDIPAQRDPATDAFYWDIPYTAGTLEAVGLVDSEPYARNLLRTHGKAVRIRVSADKAVLGGKDDLVHLEIRLEDEHGIAVPDGRTELTVEVSGQGRLLKLENGDPARMKGFDGNTSEAYKGKLLAYVVPAGNAGKIEITVSGAGLQSETVHVELKK